MFNNQHQCSALQIIALESDQQPQSLEDDDQNPKTLNKSFIVNENCDTSRILIDKIHDMSLQEISFSKFETPTKQRDALNYTYCSRGVQIIDSKKIEQKAQLQKQHDTLSKFYHRHSQQKKYLLKAGQRVKLSQKEKLQQLDNLATRKNKTPIGKTQGLGFIHEEQTRNQKTLFSQFLISQKKIKVEQKNFQIEGFPALCQTIVQQPRSKQQIIFNEEEQLSLVLINQIGMMNSSTIKTILRISKEEAETYLKNNFYRLSYLFKSKLQSYQRNLSNLYKEPKLIVTLLLIFLEKNGVKGQDLDKSTYQQIEFQGSYENTPFSSLFYSFKWNQLK